MEKSNKNRELPFGLRNFSGTLKILGILLGLVYLIMVGFKYPPISIPVKTLLALSKNNHTLSVIDPVSLKVLGTVPVGSDPHEVSASSDGKTAYVTIYGGGSLHELDIIDLVGMKPITRLDTKPFMGPHGLTFTKGKAWFTAEGSKSVASYDPKLGKIDWSMGTGQDRTHMIYVKNDGKKIYTTNVNSSTVSILTDSIIQPKPFPNGFMPPNAKPHEEWIQTVIPVGKGSEGFDVSPDGKELWTAGADEGMITIINTQTMKMTESLYAKVIGANRLKFTPDGKMVLVTSLRNGDLTIFDAETHKEIKRINTGHGAAGILVDTDGSRAFIGCTPDNYVTVVNLKTFEITAHIPIPGADGLGWAIRN